MNQPTSIKAMPSSGPAFDQGHTLGWSVEGSKFELQVASEAARLCLPDGQLIDLTNREWTALAHAIGMVVDPKQVRRPAVKTGSTQEKGPNTGLRWTSADDSELLRLWDAGGTVAELMARFDRNEGGITSRLARLRPDVNRDDIRNEDEKRRKARGAAAGN